MHCEERIFWTTMNPSRCVLLYRSYFGTAKSGTKPQEPKEETQKRSLAAYLMGGD